MSEKVWRTNWIVEIDPDTSGKGRSALKYLTPYIFRVAISNKRIVEFKDGKVSFIPIMAQRNAHRSTVHQSFLTARLAETLYQSLQKMN